MIKKKIKRKVIGFALMLIKPFIVPIMIVVLILGFVCSITDILYIGFNHEDKVDMKKELAYYDTEYKKDLWWWRNVRRNRLACSSDIIQ